MSKSKNTDGGWIWYCTKVREKLDREWTEDEVRVILTQYYIKGKPPEQAAEDLK